MTQSSTSPQTFRPRRVERVITHFEPHIDEGVAFYIASRYGARMFPGIIEAHWEFVDAGTLDLSGPNDYVAFGVGRGRYNEHPYPGQDRVEGKCAAVLVAESIFIKSGPLRGQPVSELPELKELLAYVNAHDLEGKGSKFDLGDQIKALNETFPDEPEYVMDVMTTLIDAFVQRAKKFHRGGKRAVRGAQVVDLEQTSKKGLPLRLAVMETDEDRAKANAFSEHGGYKAAVIQMNGQGQVQVFVNEKNQLDISQVAAAIRIAEIEAAGGTCTLTEAELTAEGTNPEADRWHFFPQAGCLLNGSRTAPNTEPTRLPLEKIVEIFVKYVCRKQS